MEGVAKEGARGGPEGPKAQSLRHVGRKKVRTLASVYVGVCIMLYIQAWLDK